MRARPARALPAGTPGSSRAQRGGQDEELGGAQEQDPGPAPHRDSSAALAWTRRRASYAGAGRSEDAHASAPPPPRLVSLLRPRPSLRPAVPPFPRAPRGAALFFSATRSHWFAVRELGQETSFILRAGMDPPPLLQNQTLSDGVLLSRPSIGRPCDWPTPLPARGRSTCQRTASGHPPRNPIATRTDGKSRVGEKRRRVTLGAECRWPGGPTGTRSSTLGLGQGRAVWTWDNKC